MPRIINKIQPEQGSMHSELATPAWRQPLPLDMPCQVYPRVSTRAQMLNTSAEMQNDKSFAISCGWREDLIVLDPSDLGVSGQKRMEDRLAFNAMNRRVAAGEIKAIVVYNVDRLFRDRWGVEYSKFMEMCAAYGVLVVTPEFVFDFSIEWHVERFRRKCEDAYNYIVNTVNGRLIPGRDSLMRRGYWAAGNIPVGYTVDRTLKYRKFFPYPPHAEKLVEVFLLFRACNAVLSETYRRLEAMHFLFPPFDVSIADELRGCLSLTAVYDEEGTLLGYKFGSLSGLASVLSNPVYIGCWLYKGILIRDNHPAIIEDRDLFFSAYNPLAPLTLEGEVNPFKKKGEYIKQPHADGRVLLKGVIVSGDDPEYNIYTRTHPALGAGHAGETHYAYSVCRDTDGGGSCNLRSYKADEIDALVVGKLVEMLLSTDGYLAYNDSRVSGDESAHATEMKRIKMDIASAKAAMQRNIKLLLGGTITAEDMLEALNTTQLELGQEVKRLELQYQAVEARGSEQSRRITYYELISKVGEHWKKLDASVIVDMISLFIDRVILTKVSICLYTLDMVWSDPTWQPLTALCLRESPQNKWTEAEDACLRTLYPYAPLEEVMREIPDRALNTIKQRASLKGIQRCVTGERAAYYTLAYSDLMELEKRGIDMGMFAEERVKDKKPRRVHSDNLIRCSISLLQFARVRPFTLESVIARLTSMLAA